MCIPVEVVYGLETLSGIRGWSDTGWSISGTDGKRCTKDVSVKSVNLSCNVRCPSSYLFVDNRRSNVMSIIPRSTSSIRADNNRAAPVDHVVHVALPQSSCVAIEASLIQPSAVQSGLGTCEIVSFSSHLLLLWLPTTSFTSPC